MRRKTGQKLLTKEPETKETRIEVSEASKVTCPYCLYTDYMHRFYMQLKSGKYSEKRFKCPDCGEIMRRDTLLNVMTIEEYAEWICTLGRIFWNRVDLSKFKNRLKEHGISKQFWEAYKKAKQKYKTETYEDYLMRKQMEWAEEQGLI